MVRASGSGSSGLDSNLSQGHCVVFLDRKLYYGATIHPGVEMGTGEFTI